MLGYFAVFILLGKWLDKSYPTEGFNFTFIGVFLGAFFSLYSLFKPLLKK
ncbi:MAG: hypothetical protein HKN39_08120 [Flavobacteriales bacterium]|nr:hypothetical protein [Flavobacteriales bacterium]